jgi:hypothetical protein
MTLPTDPDPPNWTDIWGSTIFPGLTAPKFTELTAEAPARLDEVFSTAPPWEKAADAAQIPTANKNHLAVTTPQISFVSAIYLQGASHDLNRIIPAV